MSESSSPKLTGAGLVAAVIVLTAWLVMLVWLVFHTGATETEWNRLIVILSSLEAIAFGAAGAIFGTTIQRQRVKDAQQARDQAEARAQKAQERGEANSEVAADGRALATVVKMRHAPSREGVERMSTQESAEEAEKELLALADRILNR